METAWQEVWSVGSNRSRTYCGIARTEEGFAVDVFHQDTCLETNVFPTREDAQRAAAACRFQYQNPQRARRAASSVRSETLTELAGVLSAQMPACGAR